MNPLPGVVRFAYGENATERLSSRLAAALNELVRCVHAHGQIRMAKIPDELADSSGGPVGARGGGAGVRRLRCWLVASIDDPPDTAACAVAAGMRQRHLVMTDDAVVKIGDIQRPVRAKLNVNRSKPRIIRLKKSLEDAFRAGAVPFDGELIDAAADDIADVSAVAPGGRIIVGGVVGDAGHGRRFSVAGVHFGAEAEAVVSFAEARIPGAAQQLIDWLRMAIGRVEIA